MNIWKTLDSKDCYKSPNEMDPENARQFHLNPYFPAEYMDDPPSLKSGHWSSEDSHLLVLTPNPATHFLANLLWKSTCSMVICTINSSEATILSHPWRMRTMSWPAEIPHLVVDHHNPPSDWVAKVTRDKHCIKMDEKRGILS